MNTINIHYVTIEHYLCVHVHCYVIYGQVHLSKKTCDAVISITSNKNVT